MGVLCGSRGADTGAVGQLWVLWGSRGSHHEMLDQDPGRDVAFLLLQGQGGLECHQHPGDTSGTRVGGGTGHDTTPQGHA